jgi:hypothetical protein
MRKILDVIWGAWEQKYFCQQDWTGGITLICFNKFDFTRKRDPLANSVIPGRVEDASPESITTAGSMDSGPAPSGASQDVQSHIGE